MPRWSWMEGKEYLQRVDLLEDYQVSPGFMVRINQKWIQCKRCCLSPVVCTKLLQPRPKPTLPEASRSLCTVSLVLRHPNESHPARQDSHHLSLLTSGSADRAPRSADEKKLSSKRFSLVQMWLNYLHVFKQMQCQSSINTIFQQNGCFSSVLLADAK